MRTALLAVLGAALTVVPPPHPAHLSYGRLVVEGRTLTFRLRLFRDDLEVALTRASGAPVTMASNARTDALFARYLDDRMFVAADGTRLTGTVVASGADDVMWWYEIRFDAPAAVRTMRLRNGVLFELYADQTNVVKVVHFPSERQFALSFATRDTEPQPIAFPAR